MKINFFSGREKLSSMPVGGGAAPAAVAASGGGAAPAEEKKGKQKICTFFYANFQKYT